MIKLIIFGLWLNLKKYFLFFSIFGLIRLLSETLKSALNNDQEQKIKKCHLLLASFKSSKSKVQSLKRV